MVVQRRSDPEVQSVLTVGMTSLVHSIRSCSRAARVGPTALLGASMDFDITASFSHPLALLRPVGELDLDTVRTIDWGVSEAIRRGCSLVGVDLWEVSFIDCSGIGALVEAKSRLEAAGSHLWVTGLSPQVWRIMKLTGTDTLFGVPDLAQDVPAHG